MIKTFSIIALISVTLIMALVVLSLTLVSDRNRTRIEGLTSRALQLETRVDGPIEIDWLRGLRYTLGDVHIGAEDAELLEAKQIGVRIAVLPLFVGKVRIISMNLSEPHIAVVRDNNDNFNFTASQAGRNTADALEIAEISFTGATLSYINTKSQATLVAQDCALQMQQLRVLNTPGAAPMLNISFRAELNCSEFHQNTYSGTDLAIAAFATDSVINFSPFTMQFLGGQGAGEMQADFSGATPQYQVHYVLPGLNLKDLLNTLPPAISAEGALDLVVNLAMQGNSTVELKQSASGTILLHSKELTLVGIDLDEKFEQFESSQNFSLVDAGAFFFVGPLGLLATKGYDFTSLLAQTDGGSAIPNLISDWIITDGIARSVDVAMTTRHNRIALQGHLDLVNEQFIDVTMALIDRDGCSVVQQQISGGFAAPHIDRPNIITTLAGPIVNILQQGVMLLTGEPCEVFYSGEVHAP